MRKKKNIQRLNDYANEAAAAGMTYGQKQAAEYAEAVIVRPVPAGYRKAAEFNRKKMGGGFISGQTGETGARIKV